MRFNASKCQVLQVTKKRDIFPAAYTIHGQVLEVVKSAKYLGVHLDNQLNFNTHVDAISRKAHGTKAFLSRNLSHCSQQVKETAYNTYVRPTVEFASAAWDPHTQRNIQKIEQVQRSAAQFVMGDYNRTSSVTDMMNILKWPSLQNRRLHSRLVMMYKIHNDLVNIKAEDYLTDHKASRHYKLRGHKSRYHRSYNDASAYSASFFPKTIRDWNNFPGDSAGYTSLDAFKSALRGLPLK